MKVTVIKGPMFEKCRQQNYIYLRRIVEEKIRRGEFKTKCGDEELKSATK